MGKSRKIYMAGKISKGDWRTKYYGRDLDLYGDLYETGKAEWKPVPVGRHVYTGPFFVRCDHGCYHGNGSHGVGAFGHELDESHGWFGCGPGGMHRDRVLRECMLAIHRSDTLFAWIDSPDCYGTIAEIGYARLVVPDIWIAGPSRYDDMWFVYQMANNIAFGLSSPHEALELFLGERLGKPDYYEYIQSGEWREKAEAAKRRSGQRCQVCNRPRSEVTLDAHHRTYERLGEELPEDITVLCRGCHELYETNRRNGNR